MRALHRTARDVIWEWDVASNRMTRGTTETQRPETPAATMSFSSWLQEIHPEDRPAVTASISSALNQGCEEWQCQYRRLRPGGKTAFVADHAYIIRDAEGHPVRLVGRSADVSESKHATRRAKPPQQFRAAFEQSPFAIVLTDNALHIVSGNRAASDLFGYSSEQFTGMHIEKLFPETRHDSLLETLLTLSWTERPSIVLDEECVRANGELFRAKINASVVSEVTDGSGGWLVTIEETAD